MIREPFPEREIRETTAVILTKVSNFFAFRTQTGGKDNNSTTRDVAISRLDYGSLESVFGQ